MSPRRLVGKCLTFLLNKSDLPFLNKGYAYFFPRWQSWGLCGL